MSHFTTVQTKIRDPACLIAALEKLKPGWVGHIEQHATPQHLYGYLNDKRAQTAHILINRKHINPGANDIGFRFGADGTAEIFISENEARYGGFGADWVKKLVKTYAEEKVKASLTAKGHSFVTEQVGENTIIRVQVWT